MPLAGQTQPDLPTLTENGPRWAADAVRPIVRTYSIRAVRPEQAEVDIEFAIHDHRGPAVDFARRAKAGDKIGISNPGGPKPMLPAADFYCGGRSFLTACAGRAAGESAAAQRRARFRPRRQHRRRD